MDWSDFISAIVGLIGVPLGILLAEFLRRRQRAEQFASAVFARRMDAYERLLSLIAEGSQIANEVIDSSDLSLEQRKDLISSAIFPIAEHTDRSILYIDEELGAHCTALFMGIEDIPDLPEAEREEALRNHQRQLRETRRMILEDSGVAKANGIFRAVNRPRITSPVIERIRELRQRQDR